MTKLLQNIAAYIPPNIVQATLSQTRPNPPATVHSERLLVAVLFADVSGFTPLTEALAQKGAEGPEELTRLLNGYFSRMIDLIEAEGGEVVKFSGDAMTVVFPAHNQTLGEATRRAKQAATAMQAAMSDFTTLQTSVGSVALGMKIGVAAGEIIAARVGGVGGRWEYIIAGDPLRQVAEAEHQAERGDIVLSPEATAILSPHALPPRPLQHPDWSQVQQPEAVEKVLECYIPGAVAAWLKDDLGDWLAVLRPMTVLFVGIGGLDYQQPHTIEQLHNFLRAIQETVGKYEGSINKVAVDDKGTIFIALFGAPPKAHEDDPARGIRCALELQTVAFAQGLQLAIGVTTGRVFTGPVGSSTRREYTVMGDAVNLAARLMVTAGLGQTRCDYETYRNARHQLAFETLQPVKVKGKAGEIRLYKPLGENRPEALTSRLDRFIGRRLELAKLQLSLNHLQEGHSRNLLIEGEAGIGKSRLVDELRRLLYERKMTSLLGAGLSTEQQTPFRAWRDIFLAYFGLENIDQLADRQASVRQQVTEILPELIERLPLLNDLLNLELPENRLTASLDSELRHESLFSFLIELLKVRAKERPLVLILEDAHWLDSLSWELTIQVARSLNVARLPFLLTAVMRPLEGDLMRFEPTMLSKMENSDRLSLKILPPDDIVELAASRLGLPRGDSLPSVLADLIRDRSGGNPFFAEELLHYLQEENLFRLDYSSLPPRCELSGQLDQAVSALPDTMQGIVLSRIDRLPPEAQLTLKVAAVIGRTFVISTLQQTIKEHTEISERMIRNHLDDLKHLDLTPQEALEPELTYIFKHIITQEVAYNTLLFAQRRQLHRTVARLFERTFNPQSSPDEAATEADNPLAALTLTPALTPYYPLLVYHWHHAEDKGQERRYCWLAGQSAVAQFANEEAIRYFSRALELTPADKLIDRYDLLLAREAIYDIRGEREAQAEDLKALAELAPQLEPAQQAMVALRQANYGEVTSDYEVALAAAQQAIAQAEQVDDTARVIEGHIAWGKALWRQGDYDAATVPLEKALTLARTTHQRPAEAESLGLLGDIYLYLNNFPAAEEHFQQAIEMYHELGDRQGEAYNLGGLAVICNDLGDYAAARKHNEQVLTLYHTIGYRRGEAIVFNNLGVNYCDLGDYEASHQYHTQALEIRKAIDERYGEAQSLSNLALVCWGLKQYETARTHAERSLVILREVGAKRDIGYSLTYLGHALTSLGDLAEATQAYAEARDLRRELGQDSLAMDDVAGLARVALAQQDLALALTYVEEILRWLATEGIDGIEYPLQVYHTCYLILRQAEDDRAASILNTAHQVLQERANGISDLELQQKFLQNIEAHREIGAAFARTAHLPIMTE